MQILKFYHQRHTLFSSIHRKDRDTCRMKSTPLDIGYADYKDQTQSRQQ